MELGPAASRDSSSGETWSPDQKPPAPELTLSLVLQFGPHLTWIRTSQVKECRSGNQLTLEIRPAASSQLNSFTVIVSRANNESRIAMLQYHNTHKTQDNKITPNIKILINCCQGSKCKSDNIAASCHLRSELIAQIALGKKDVSEFGCMCSYSSVLPARGQQFKDVFSF